MAVISLSKSGRWPSLRLRPRNAKPSMHTIPLSTSCFPLRSVPRFQSSSRSASRWPPSPRACTVRAINIRRVLPLRSLTVFNTSALTSSVSSTLVPPRTIFLAQSIILGRFIFRKSLRGLLCPAERVQCTAEPGNEQSKQRWAHRQKRNGSKERRVDWRSLVISNRNGHAAKWRLHNGQKANGQRPCASSQHSEQHMSWAERHVQWMIDNNCDDHGNPWPE